MAPQVDSADPTTADDDSAAPSADEVEIDGSEIEDPEGDEPEGDEVEKEPDVIQTRNTQKRFDELTATIRRMEREAEEARRRAPLAFYQGEPKPDDFDSDIDYAAALGAYNGAKNVVTMINGRDTQDSQTAARQETQRALDSYNAKVADVIKATPDFRQTIAYSLLQTQDARGYLTPATEAILAADNGPAVAYHIATNPEIATRLNRASPVQAGMIVASLSAKLSPSPRKPKPLPAPIGSEGTGKRLAKATDGLRHLGKARFE